MDALQLIIKREFENASLGQYRVTGVEFREDETIVVTCEGHHPFTMEIGSDDDQFIFTSPAGRVVCFGYPTDWPEAL